MKFIFLYLILKIGDKSFHGNSPFYGSHTSEVANKGKSYINTLKASQFTENPAYYSIYVLPFLSL